MEEWVVYYKQLYGNLASTILGASMESLRSHFPSLSLRRKRFGNTAIPRSSSAFLSSLLSSSFSFALFFLVPLAQLLAAPYRLVVASRKPSHICLAATMMTSVTPQDLPRRYSMYYTRITLGEKIDLSVPAMGIDNNRHMDKKVVLVESTRLIHRDWRNDFEEEQYGLEVHIRRCVRGSLVGYAKGVYTVEGVRTYEQI